MRAVAWLFALIAAAQTSASAQEGLIESRESLYNNIYVVERGDYLYMQFGKNKRFWTESVYFKPDPRVLAVDYTRVQTVAVAYPAKLDSILEIGLGGGRTAAYLHMYLPEVPLHSVELDPDVVELAEKYFELKQDETFRITTRDGRIHLVRDKTMHDLILVDAYRGPFVPFHLLTREFYLTAKRRMNPGGVMAQNIEPSTMLFDAALATIASVFEHVELYPAQGNVVAIAYDGPQRLHDDLKARAAALQAAHGFYYDLPELLADRRLVTRPPEQDPLVDDFAPVEMLKSIERHNQPLDDISQPAEQ